MDSFETKEAIKTHDELITNLSYTIYNIQLTSTDKNSFTTVSNRVFLTM